MASRGVHFGVLGMGKRYVDFAMPTRLGYCRCICIRGSIRNDVGAQKTHTGFPAKCTPLLSLVEAFRLCQAT